jgi:D-sedoheptulose 7-phosphate isomerase
VEAWADYFETIAQGLREVVVTNRDGRTLPAADGVSQWVSMTRAVQQRDAHLYIIGNGGSAGMASHMATDAAKNGRLRALACSAATVRPAGARIIA